MLKFWSAKQYITLADLGGVLGTCPNSFVFAYIFAKSTCVGGPHPPNGSMPPPYREILDPPLYYVFFYCKMLSFFIKYMNGKWDVVALFPFCPTDLFISSFIDRSHFTFAMHLVSVVLLTFSDGKCWQTLKKNMANANGQGGH